MNRLIASLPRCRGLYQPLEMLMMSQRESFREPLLNKSFIPAIPEPHPWLRGKSLWLWDMNCLGISQGAHAVSAHGLASKQLYGEK